MHFGIIVCDYVCELWRPYEVCICVYSCCTCHVSCRNGDKMLCYSFLSSGWKIVLVWVVMGKILGSLPPNEVPYIRSVPHTDGSDGRNGRVLHRITAPSRIFNLTAIFSDFVEKKCKNGIWIHVYQKLFKAYRFQMVTSQYRRGAVIAPVSLLHITD